jgi:hypothetical protein
MGICTSTLSKKYAQDHINKIPNCIIKKYGKSEVKFWLIYYYESIIYERQKIIKPIFDIPKVEWDLIKKQLTEPNKWLKNIVS